MSRMWFYTGIFILSILFNTPDLHGNELSDIAGVHNVSFSEVHGWPGGRCSICHISPSPGAEAAELNNSDLSRLCESCHKGTVSILPSNRLRSEVQKMANHPIKFSPLDFDPDKINHIIVEENNRFYISGKTGKVPIFGTTAASALVECTTCHDSHGTADMPNMPRISNLKGELCLVCHLNFKVNE